MKKLLKKLHLWLSLPAGIFFVLLCLTGTILVFQREIQRIVGPDYYYVKSSEKAVRLSVDSLVHVAQSIAETDGHQVSSMTVYADPDRTCEFGVDGEKGAFYTLDPYTAKLTGAGVPAADFFSWIRGLHRWLLTSGDGRTIGRSIVGIVSLCSFIILISGLVIAIPPQLRQLKTAFQARHGRVPRVWWYTSHRACGLYCVCFLLLMAVTGPMWSFSWYKTGVASLLGISQNQTSNTTTSSHESSLDKKASVNTLAWTQALEAISQKVPDWVSISLKPGSATVKTPAHHYRASDTYNFDSEGHLTSVKQYTDLSASDKLMGYVYIIHTGEWGGWFVKVLYLLAVLGGIYLVISGYWLYFKRIFKN